MVFWKLKRYEVQTEWELTQSKRRKFCCEGRWRLTRSASEDRSHWPYPEPRRGSPEPRCRGWRTVTRLILSEEAEIGKRVLFLALHLYSLQHTAEGDWRQIRVQSFGWWDTSAYTIWRDMIWQETCVPDVGIWTWTKRGPSLNEKRDKRFDIFSRGAEMCTTFAELCLSDSRIPRWWGDNLLFSGTNSQTRGLTMPAPACVHAATSTL